MSAVFGATPFEFTPPRTYRPTFQGRKQMVVAGHYLASMAGNRILEAGGNAVDAGVATGICINVLQPDMTSFGGVAPMVIYLADRREVVTIGGLGRWPKKASTAYFKENYEGRIPSGRAPHGDAGRRRRLADGAGEVRHDVVRRSRGTCPRNVPSKASRSTSSSMTT